MWQVCSLMLTALGTIINYLGMRNGSTLPFLNLTISYVCLLLMSCWSVPKTTAKWWGYLIVSLCNLGGDVASIYAYTLTSLSTAQLLVTTVIFFVAPLGYIFFRRILSWVQILAILLGAAGAVIVFITDGKGDSRWQGNLIALVSSLCYAIATTLVEKLVHEGSNRIYLFRFGVCTSPVALILCLSIEIKPIKNYNWDAVVIVLTILYGVTMAVYYAFVPVIMNFSTATEMNLSFLTSNFFGLFISIWAFGQKFTWQYFVGFLCVPAAIILFCLFPPKPKNQEPAAPIGEDVAVVPEL